MVKAFIGGVEGKTLTDAERAFLAHEKPYGIILFARNIGDPAQVSALTAEIKSLLDHPYASVLIDQEGGRVARMKPPHWRKYPPAKFFADMPDRAAARTAVELNARLLGDELRAVGITTDCAPVADVLAPECHAIIGDRAFGDTGEKVADLAGAQAKGLLAAGILPILKHLPGHGRATQDSHLHLPRVSTSLAELWASDFIPFKALKDVPLAMTAHIIYEAIDPERCATVSPIVIQFIRQEIGYDGLIMSDDLSMKALSGSFAQKTERTLAAGCDLVLHGNGALVGEAAERDLMAEMQEIADACAPMTADAIRRAQNALLCLPVAPAPVAGAALAQWQSLTAA
jgi:beta-N-acetylhexosaminidase